MYISCFLQVQSIVKMLHRQKLTFETSLQNLHYTKKTEKGSTRDFFFLFFLTSWRTSVDARNGNTHNLIEKLCHFQSSLSFKFHKSVINCSWCLLFWIPSFLDRVCIAYQEQKKINFFITIADPQNSYEHQLHWYQNETVSLLSWLAETQ